MKASCNMDGWNWAARLLHFSDSALPVGAYAHSFGLEGVCQMGVVEDEDTLVLFLCRDVAGALYSVDLPLFALAYEAAMDGVVEDLQRLDQLSWALRPTRQLREAASKIGKQQWRLYQRTWQGGPEVDLPCEQSPIIMGLIFANEAIPMEAGLWSIAYQTYSALVQAALKLLPIGPASAQHVLHLAMEAIGPHLEDAAGLSEDSVGTFNPVWDIGASQHEEAKARMFIS
ncbi:MAG: urease accessory UreF family protein [Verrucomicrobiota bacterium]